MRIGLNLLHALPEIGGGWNYIRQLVAALAEYDPTNFYVAFVTNASECLVPTQSNFEKVLIAINSRSRPQRILYENTILQYWARRYRLNCMHWFANTQGLINAVPALVTIHDLQPFLEYAKFSVIKRVYLQWMMAITAQRASVLLPVSQSAAKDMQDKLGADSEKMVVVPAIIAPEFEPAPAEDIALLRNKYDLPSDFWLYVAHLYSHKNHVRLLRAYHFLKVNGHCFWPLVFRGDTQDAESAVREVITELGLTQDVIWLPRMELYELRALYSAASALVFPSLYEGGGIPVLEAMACGCPLVAADISPIREHAAEVAIYFNPTDIDSIASAMLTFENLTTAQIEQRRQSGLERSAKFRPLSVVKHLLDAYAKASAVH